MTTATLSREGLHAIENASRDEITSLQLERMKWSVRHAYENSPFYAKRFDDHRVHPDDLGKVIGRAGRTATALRTVMSAVGGRGIRVDVVDTDR